MPDLALLNTELEDIVAKRNLLREKHRGDTMPEEARAEDQALTDRAQKVTKLIEVEKQKNRDAIFDQTAKYMDDPVYQVPRAVNADDDGRRVLQRAGWGITNGMITRQTSIGQELALYPEEVMFGSIPTDDPIAAQYFKQTRAIIQPEYRNAYVKWLRSPARNDSLAFAQLTQSEQNALSEGTDSAGGFVVPPDIQAEILVRLPQTSVMRRLARIIPTSRDRVQFPAIAPNSSNGSIYSSGFVGGWVGETPAFSDTDPGFQQFELGIRKLRVATKLSNDWLADAAANMLAFLSQNGAENMGLVEDNGFIAGTGTPLQPTGVLNSGISTVDVEGSTANTISNSTAALGSSPKLQDLVYGVPSQYAERASFLMRRSIEGKIRKLVDANGRPIWLSANDGGLAPTPRTIDGYPVNNSEFMPDDGADGNKVLIFGDFANYIIAQRAQMSTVVLRERFADTDQTGIILFERVGGGVWNTDAFRIGIV